MSVRHHRRPLLASAVLVVGATLALTACGPENTDPAGGSTAAAPAPAAAAPSTSAGAPTGAPATGSASHSAAPKPTAASPSGAARPDGGNAGADARPCDMESLTVQATARSGAAHQWVIEVRNTGASACSLSSTPSVDLGDSAARDQSRNIKPVLASGTSRFPVPAGKSAYAVIDLDPSGATTGTVPGINEINVLVDQDGTDMPLANTRNFPLPSGARVLDPKLGLYRATVAEAVASMTAAPK